MLSIVRFLQKYDVTFVAGSCFILPAMIIVMGCAWAYVRFGKLPQIESLLYGVKPTLQKRLAASGHKVRIYIPYGEDWYAYLVRRLAERPANLALLLRSLTSRR